MAFLNKFHYLFDYSSVISVEQKKPNFLKKAIKKLVEAYSFYSQVMALERIPSF